jgi:O-antigen biosynthesis protein
MIPMNTVKSSGLATDMLPVTSLIVCSRNRPVLLVESIRSILEGDIVPAELIIIDQSDEPNRSLTSLTTTRNCTIRYIWSQSVGLSRANNIGVAAASGDILVFSHDDVTVTRTWFGALVSALHAAGRRSVVTGQVLPTEVTIPGGFAPSTKVDPVAAAYEGRIDKDVLFPMNMAMYRSAVDEVGGFDERLGPGTSFPAAEDNDFGFRLLEAGYRICYVPEATLYHCAWRKAQDYLPLRWNYGRGQGAYYAKYLSIHDRYMLRRMVRGFRDHLLQSVWQIRRQRRRAYGSVIYALGLISGAAQWLVTHGGLRRGGARISNHKTIRRHVS